MANLAVQLVELRNRQRRDEISHPTPKPGRFVSSSMDRIRENTAAHSLASPRRVIPPAFTPTGPPPPPPQSPNYPNSPPAMPPFLELRRPPQPRSSPPLYCCVGCAAVLLECVDPATVVKFDSQCVRIYNLQGTNSFVHVSIINLFNY